MPVLGFSQGFTKLFRALWEFQSQGQSWGYNRKINEEPCCIEYNGVYNKECDIDTILCHDNNVCDTIYVPIYEKN